MTPDQVVALYIRDKRPAVRKQKSFFASLTLSEAIREAASKKHGTHQYRLPRAALRDAAKRLLRSKLRLASSPSFRQLIRSVQEIIGPIFGIGELTIYDVSVRIGYNVGLSPEIVYLHAGAADGAAALEVGGATVPRDKFPSALLRLSAAEIENCLCIYKDQLWGRSRGRTGRKCRGPGGAPRFTRHSPGLVRDMRRSC